MGQKLRSLGIKHVRVRINGFNAARVSTVKGITQVNKPTVTYILFVVLLFYRYQYRFVQIITLANI